MHFLRTDVKTLLNELCLYDKLTRSYAECDFKQSFDQKLAD